MALFAKIGLNSKVIAVQAVHNNELLDADGVEQEVNGASFLADLTGWSIWKQTSYNTRRGVHSLGGTPLRKNLAGIGFTYDEDRDAFIEPKPYPSWVLDEGTCSWGAPTAYPTDGKKYVWDEGTTAWAEVE